MSYLYVKWNSFGRGLLASGLAIKACPASPWPLPGTEACDAAGGGSRPQWRERSAPHLTRVPSGPRSGARHRLHRLFFDSGLSLGCGIAK